jgi:SAM-dependent methyltransferase
MEVFMKKKREREVPTSLDEVPLSDNKYKKHKKKEIPVFNDPDTHYMSKKNKSPTLKKPTTYINIKSWNGIGDLLFCTPTLHMIKLGYPETYITVSTNYPDLLEGNPYVDKIDRVSKEGTFLGYDDPIHRKNPTCHHIIKDWEIIRDEYILPDLAEPQLKPEIYLPVAPVRGDTIGVQVDHKGHWDNKKVWPKFNELATRPGFRPIPKCKDIKELVYAISRYKAVVCSEGGISHIARAVNTPTIVIYGGFAKPEWNGYKEQINICNPMHCSYCYNPDKCVHPIPRACLATITMEQVLDAVEGLSRIDSLHKHNAKQFCEADALKWCKGKGVDIGGGRFPLKGADNVDDHPGTNHDQLKLGMADSSQDFVFSSHTLEHLKDPAASLREWSRVLKPNGIMYLYLPHEDYIPWRKETMPKYHLWNLSEAVLTGFLNTVKDLEIIEWVDQDAHHGRKIILRKRG